MIINDEIQFIFSDLTTERRNVEFKQSIDWNNTNSKSMIAKSVLAFSNTRDGGYLVIGVNKVGNNYVPVGMTPAHLLSFDNFDDIQQWINARAEPPVTIERTVYTDSGMNFFIIKVHEFDRYPIVCTQGAGHILHKGVLYVRTKVMPQSAPIDNQTNLHEIVDMIITKHSEEFAKRLSQVNALLGEDGDEESYENELEGL